MPKQCGLAMEDALLQPIEEGLGSLKVYNVSGFTERMEEGMILGNAVEVCIVELAEECSSIISTATTDRQILTSQEHNHQKKLWELSSKGHSPFIGCLIGEALLISISSCIKSVSPRSASSRANT